MPLGFAGFPSKSSIILNLAVLPWKLISIVSSTNQYILVSWVLTVIVVPGVNSPPIVPLSKAKSLCKLLLKLPTTFLITLVVVLE